MYPAVLVTLALAGVSRAAEDVVQAIVCQDSDAGKTTTCCEGLGNIQKITAPVEYMYKGDACFINPSNHPLKDVETKFFSCLYPNTARPGEPFCHEVNTTFFTNNHMQVPDYAPSDAAASSNSASAEPSSTSTASPSATSSASRRAAVPLFAVLVIAAASLL